MHGSARGLEVSARQCTGAQSEYTAVYGGCAAPSEPDAKHVVNFLEFFFVVSMVLYRTVLQPFSKFTLEHNFLRSFR